MSKKEKIIIRRDDDLVDIDDELDLALQMLDGANQRIVDLLSTMEPLKAMPELDEAGEAGEAASHSSAEDPPPSTDAP